MPRAAIALLSPRWTGNAPNVATATCMHYLQVTDEHFEKAVQNPVQQSAAVTRNELQDEPAAHEKTRKLQDTAIECGSLQFVGMGDEGLEQHRKTRGKMAVGEESVPLVSHSGENVALWSDIRALIAVCPDLSEEARLRLIQHGDEARRKPVTG